ncbi:MAG: amidohydrolase family protein [Syntrophobacteraceae bacterium]|nr:amidohydrolase family protein [Syntrophobacteraceae bacterium]
MASSRRDVLKGAAGAQVQAGPRYDLLLKGGEFIDPGSGRRGQFDVAFVGDKVAAIGPGLPSGLAKQVESAAGAMVVPGVIDMHAHAADGLGPSCNPDVIGVNRGVTTILDGGSCGVGSFRVLRYVAAANKTRVLAMLNLSSMGLIDLRAGELILRNLVDVEEVVQAAKSNPDLVVGFKGRLSTYVTGQAPALPILKLLLEAGKEANLPVMVHVGDTAEPLGEILDLLRPGDICSHYLTPRKNGILGSQAFPGAKLIPEIFEARKRGVILDIARGRTMHMGFPQMQATVEAGLLPDTISTDLTSLSIPFPEVNVFSIATALMSFGVPLEECLKELTVNPAMAMRRPELGKLEEGGIGDATLLKVEEGDFTVSDVDGRTRKTNKRVVAVGVVRAGSYMKIEPPPKN